MHALCYPSHPPWLQVLELGRRLLRLLALCLDLPQGWFLDRFTKPIAILRPLHYSPKPSRPEEVNPGNPAP